MGQYQVLDYWREGVIPTVHYSPHLLALRDRAEDQITFSPRLGSGGA